MHDEQHASLAESEVFRHGPDRLARWGPPVLIVAMMVLALVLLLPVLSSSPDAALSPQVPLLALFVGFVAFEAVVLHVPLGRDLDHAEELNLTEIVLVLGLYVAAPADLVVATVAATVLVNLFRRAQPPLKQLFNATSRLVDTSIALTVFGVLAPADPLSISGWLAGSAAGVAAGFASSLTVALVMRCVAGPIPVREVALNIFSSVPLSVLCSAVAYVGVLGLQADGSATIPILLAVGSLLLIVRTTTVLAERHLHLAELHQFANEIAATSEVASLLSVTLSTVTDLVHARDVTAYVVTDADSDALAYRSGKGGALSEAAVRSAAVPDDRGVVNRRSRLVAAAPLVDGGKLVLVVDGRRSGMGWFRREDARVLDLVTHRAGSDLHTLLLIDRLRFEALHDALTGLPNVRAITDAARNHDLTHHPLAAIWLGLHGMQEVNEALGHQLGEELLGQVGRRLAHACGPDTMVARMGGDEFAILLPRSGSVTPLDRATSVVSDLASPFLVAEVPVLLQGRAGVAVLPAGAPVPAVDVLRRADLAMRRANTTGWPVVEYAATMETSTPALLTLASELQAGIAEDQLVLLAQPQQRLRDGAASGVELLVRWDHPRLGMLTPDRFLPLAASTGLDRPLTAWVVEAAFAALAEWRLHELDLRISINVVPAMITDGSILQLLERLLASHPQLAERITIEVVESGLLESPEHAAEVLRAVAALGVQVSIDDFGTGYSSLSHLRRLPVDEIKIDKSFVTSMLTDDDDAAIVTALIAMGHSLGLTVIAEGVETQAVLDRLRLLGCDTGQGFHLARPMPLTDLPAWALRHQMIPALDDGIQR